MIEYLDYQKLIHKLVWKFQKKFNCPFQELLSEANLAFCIAIKTYNPNISQFSTYLCNTINIRIRNYIKKESKQNRIKQRLVNQALISGEDKIDLINLHNFSIEAREIFKVIFESPAELYNNITQTNKKISQSMLRQYFRNKGWLFQTIDNSFLEIKSKLFD